MTEIIVALIAAISGVVVALINIVPRLNNNEYEDEVLIFPIDYDEDEYSPYDSDF